MNNNEKFEEHKKLLDECRSKGVIHAKPSVREMEKLKYSDDPLIRKACAIIEYADEMQMNILLGRAC